MQKFYIIIGIFIFISAYACNKEEKDITPPEINLKGYNPTYVNLDSAYVESGYTAIDDVDGDLTNKVKVTGTVATHAEGDYTLYYNVSDEAGNAAEEKTRKVKVLKF